MNKLFLFFIFIYTSLAVKAQQWVLLDPYIEKPYCIEKLQNEQYVIFVWNGDYSKTLRKLDGINGIIVDSLTPPGNITVPCCFTIDVLKSFSDGVYTLFATGLDLSFPYDIDIVRYDFTDDLEISSVSPIGFGPFSPFELVYDAYQDSDSTVLLTGYNFQGNGSDNLLVFKINRFTNEVIWSKYYLATLGFDERGIRIVLASDGGFFIVGRNGTSNTPVFVKRITDTGDEIWTKYYEGAGEADAVHGGDSSIVISSLGTVFKINYDGEIIWKHEIQGCPGSTCFGARKIRRTDDERFVAMGVKYDVIDAVFTTRIGLYYYAENGDIEEQYYFADTTGAANYNPIDFAPTDDGEFIIVSTLTGGYMHVLKTNIKDLKPPAAGFSFQPNNLDVVFTDTSSFNPTVWHWDFGDGDTSALQHPVHTYEEEGVYEVCLIASNANGSDTTCQWVELELSSVGEERIVNGGVWVSPNPAKEELYIRWNQPADPIVAIAVYNVLGQQVYWAPVLRGEDVHTISVVHWPEEVYFIRLQADQGRDRQLLFQVKR